MVHRLALRCESDYFKKKHKKNVKIEGIFLIVSLNLTNQIINNNMVWVFKKIKMAKNTIKNK
jgi:hypothetical protein